MPVFKVAVVLGRRLLRLNADAMALLRPDSILACLVSRHLVGRNLVVVRRIDCEVVLRSASWLGLVLIHTLDLRILVVVRQ